SEVPGSDRTLTTCPGWSFLSSTFRPSRSTNRSRRHHFSILNIACVSRGKPNFRWVFSGIYNNSTCVPSFIHTAVHGSSGETSQLVRAVRLSLDYQYLVCSGVTGTTFC